MVNRSSFAHSKGWSCKACGFAYLLAALTASCGDKKESTGSNNGQSENPDNAFSTKLRLSAGGLNTAQEGNLTSPVIKLLDPASEELGYPGIGINYGDVVLEGFKINLRQITMAGMPGTQDGGPNAVLADFGTEGKELQIAEGFRGTIQVDTSLVIPDGVYRTISLAFENSMQVKAWAYLDTDNNGTTDTTIWTTPSGIQKSATKITLQTAMTGYDYYKYPWAMPLTASSLIDNSTSNTGVLTQFRDPVEVKAGKILTSGTESDTLDLNVLIDTYNIVKVWDGRYGNSNPEEVIMGTPTPFGEGIRLPPPVMPFPQGAQDSRSGCCGISMNQFFPASQPNFAMSNYLSAFGLVNQGGLKAQIYLVGKDAAFTPFNTQAMTVLLDSNGEPLFARMGIGELNTTLHIGPFAKLFEKQSDGTYNFATSGSSTDSEGKEDGGLHYGNTTDKAGHLFSGFRKATIGQRYSMTMKDGPRCKAEYDYCVKTADGVTAYVQRVR